MLPSPASGTTWAGQNEGATEQPELRLQASAMPQPCLSSCEPRGQSRAERVGTTPPHSLHSPRSICSFYKVRKSRESGAISYPSGRSGVGPAPPLPSVQAPGLYRSMRALGWQREAARWHCGRANDYSVVFSTALCPLFLSPGAGWRGGAAGRGRRDWPSAPPSLPPPAPVRSALPGRCTQPAWQDGGSRGCGGRCHSLSQLSSNYCSS